MTIIDDRRPGGEVEFGADGGLCGDGDGDGVGEGFVWFAVEGRGFDPVSDVAIGESPLVGVEWVEAVVEHAAQALSMLEQLDPGGFDAATTAAWAKGVEQLRRQAEAAGVAVVDHLDAAQPFRELGFFTAKAWVKHHLQLSGPEAHARVQQARLRGAVGVWNRALAGGQVGVAQSRLMARIAANPRIDPEVLTAGVWELMADAMDVSFVEFERRALVFEALADPVGAAEKSERNRQRRHATMVQNLDGGWELHASFDEVGGPEFLEIFCWYVDREFRADWNHAVEVLGDGNVDAAKLRRSEAQRRADALVEMARAAAACPPGRQRPLPTVNFLLDAASAEAAADGHRLDPGRYREVISRTDRGDRVNANAIIAVSMWALIRRVVTNTKGVVIELGRTQRLFTGHARDAVMLLEAECIWPGCDQPHARCHADHVTSWSERGPTDPDNGAPLCARHNHLKELGFTIRRDDHGHWHITAPNGTHIS